MEYINVRGLDKPVPKLIFGTAWFSLDAEEEEYEEDSYDYDEYDDDSYYE